MSVAIVILALLAGFGGLVVLAVFGWRLYREVRSLGHTVADAGTRLAEAAAELEALAPHDD